MTVIPIHVDELPEGSIPVDMVSVVKFLDEEGHESLAIRTSKGLSHWDIIGMLVAGSDAARAALTAEMVDKREDD